MLHWSSQRILHVWHGFVLGFAILLLTPSDQASSHVSAPLAEEPATKMSSLPPQFGMLFSFFERNIGQFDDSVKYVGRGPHHTILFRQHEVDWHSTFTTKRHMAIHYKEFGWVIGFI
jgi:hypothetical protein